MREYTLMGRGAGGRTWLVMFVPGMMLIVLGVLIVLMPQLLIAMVAACFIVAGLGLASMGWRMRSMGGIVGLGGFRPPGGDSGAPDMR